MSWWIRIILGAVISGIGFFIAWRTLSIMDVVGRSYWAETKFSTWGGTIAFYKLIGVGIILIGLMIITNLHVVFLTFITGPLFNVQR
jgi:hypothetical protein